LSLYLFQYVVVVVAVVVVVDDDDGGGGGGDDDDDDVWHIIQCLAMKCSYCTTTN